MAQHTRRPKNTFSLPALAWRLAAALWLCAWLSGWLAAPPPAQASGQTATLPAPDPRGSVVLLIKMEGPVTPVMSEYLKRSIRVANERQAELIIFQLNTPGGSIGALNAAIEVLRASPVPIVVYVAPRGAMAGSAGVLITLAGHAAAMSPETGIGAASPVDSQGEDLEDTMDRKIKNMLIASADSLTTQRPQTARDLARRTIEEALAVSADEALSAGLVDFIASSPQDLLRQMHGFRVQVQGADGELVARTLDTTGLTMQELPLNALEQALLVLTDPNIVFLLLLGGVVLLMIEISSPGGWVSGFAGVVCLALATYGMGVLSVNWFGLIFIATAFVLFAMEVNAPTHGALTAAGGAALVVGALVLFNSPGTPQFQQVSLPLVLVATGLAVGAFLVILSIALRVQKAPIQTGSDRLVGGMGIARNELAPNGLVQLNGEVWSAQSVGGEHIPAGSTVQVVSVEGLRLQVKPAAPHQPPPSA